MTAWLEAARARGPVSSGSKQLWVHCHSVSSDTERDRHACTVHDRLLMTDPGPKARATPGALFLARLQETLGGVGPTPTLPRTLGEQPGAMGGAWHHFQVRSVWRPSCAPVALSQMERVFCQHRPCVILVGRSPCSAGHGFWLLPLRPRGVRGPAVQACSRVSPGPGHTRLEGEGASPGHGRAKLELCGAQRALL